VQFRGPIRSQWKEALEATGARIVNYHPHYAFLVRADEETMNRVRALGAVNWTGLYQPAYKISKAFTGKTGTLEAKVLVFRDEDMTDATRALEAAGAQILQTSDNGINKLLRVSFHSDGLARLAALRQVQWMEPYELPVPLNATDQWIQQTHVSNNRAIWNHGIRGLKQVVSTSDTGIRTTHRMFKDPAVPITSGTIDYPTHRKIIAYRTMTGATFGDEGSALNQTYHGTHTAGTSCGNDSINGGTSTLDGLAPDAKTYFCDIGSFSSQQQVLTGLPLDLNDLYIFPYTGNTGGHASVMSNSWGFQDASFYGEYELNAMQSDQFMWDHKDFLIFFSNGNAGPTTPSVLPPATAKNIVSVGATDDVNGNTIASYSSRGNCDDGRIKPTIVCPGDNVQSAWGKDDTSYHSLSGTSMASPGAMASTALIRQYLAEGWYPSGTQNVADAIANPSAALMKAMLVNSADPGSTFPGTDWGWGRVDLDSAMFFAGDTRDLALVENTPGLVTGDAVNYQVNVIGSSIPLKITLVWTDYPGAPDAAKELVNDLNLTVTSPTSSVYLGNVLSGGQSTTGGTADNTNVEEWVRLNAPTTGTYTIRVAAANTPVGPQPFALVVTGDLDRTAALLTLNKAAYGPTDVINVRLEDSSPGLTSPVVRFTSTSNDTESVTLTNVGPHVFTGSLPLLFGVIMSGDGQLSVSNGDIITATYQDAAPVTTRTVTALVDATAFTISQVRATSIVQLAATINWTTSDGGSSKVYYGTTPSLGLTSAFDPNLVTNHAVLLTNLTANTTYYYDVESQDARGNTVRDDNGGRHYTFTTGTAPDVYLVIGDSSTPAENVTRYFNAFNRHGWTFDYNINDVTGDPPLGNKTSGLRSYPVVWWNAGEEQYPVFSDAQISLFKSLHNSGARIAAAAHDAVWDLASGQSGSHTTTTTRNFIQDYLHEAYQNDPPDINYVGGVPGDPISGNYVSGISYTEIRQGGAADEVSLYPEGGTEVLNWIDDTTPDSIGSRWIAPAPLGSPDSAAWGGTATKTVVLNFEPMRLNYATMDDQVRSDVVNNVLLWLIGHDHPTVTVTAPVGGSTITSSPVTIAWTASAAPGFSIGTTTLQYSQDLGQSWVTIASGVLTSPYSWDITSVVNSPHTRVRVLVADNANPALHASSSTGNFVINRPGGDILGPNTVAGSCVLSPNPVTQGTNLSVSAAITDTTAGSSNIHAAEYSIGASPAPAGTGTPMSASGGSFDTSPNLGVVATVSTGSLSCASACTFTLWVRAQDQAGNWGPAYACPFTLRAGITDVAEEPGVISAARFALRQNVPNPFRPATDIRFSLERQGSAALRIFDINGSLVRTVFTATLSAGPHIARWDGTNDLGLRVPSGVYFYRLDTVGNTATRKMVKMD
jgi:hypothetical protein